ncbi:(4Fe-4S)-binding protein, partial [Candidatus Acetothermia bacterium]
FCATEGIPILLKIPFEREIARLYSQGIPLVDAIPEWKERFQALYETATAELVQKGGVE